MIVGGGSKIMGGRAWWQQNYGGLCVVVGDGIKIMAGGGWS